MSDVRKFLFLQGPHGPFFRQLAGALRAAGAEVWRVGFNRGDEVFWADRATYLPHTGRPEDWPAHLDRLITAQGFTDLVLYGDVRPIHAAAVAAGRARGLRVHVFEEGYLRPYWASYERGGSSGHSRLMTIGLDEMRAALGDAAQPPLSAAPARWGDMREHVFYGARYHFLVLVGNRRYRAFRPHRGLSVGREFRLHLANLLLMPLHRIERARAEARIRRSGFDYHLVLLQLEHDASFQAHGPFARMADFIEAVLAGFASGAPADQHLVFKAHPLEDGRGGLRAAIRAGARRHGLTGRVHYVRGGKLARLLSGARACVTVNSTAAEQALWRGLPVRALGRAVYGKPGLVSDQPLADFFAAPHPPDPEAYRIYRRYLLETSQIPGGYYSARGRRQLVARMAGLMLDPMDRYDRLATQRRGGAATPRQE